MYRFPRRSTFLMLIATIAILLARPVRAQETSALIEQALDRQVKLDLKDLTLPQAVDQIRQQTALPLRVLPRAYDLLPWGDQTVISARIENETLRQAMTVLTRKLGLTFAVTAEEVVVQPMPALARLGRRATVQELSALDLLATTPLEPASNRMAEKDLAAAVDAKLKALHSQTAVDNEPGDRAMLDQPVAVARNATLMDALEAIGRQTRATWYPWGKTVLITSKEELIASQLSRPVTLHWGGSDVVQVLTELSQEADVPFEIEPGALLHIPAEARRIKFTLTDAHISQALDAICGFTGLAYTVTDRGVYIWNPADANNAAGAAAAAGQNGLMGMVPLGDGMQMLVPESQLPPDVRDYLRAKQQQAIERLRKLMTEEGFKPPSASPTKQPATQPDEHL